MNAQACFHCGEANPDSAPILARVQGRQHAVCCPGCKAAAEWIETLGLADYYRLRSGPAQR
ncbi:MAG: heavy metal translocating P-type ATPase metal-binding domain-containing protein, partial [Dokdonella sp.]